MKIEFDDRFTIPVGLLEPGECFYDGDKTKVYMKLRESSDVQYNAVNLYTGVLHDFTDDCEVSKLKAKVVINQ